MNYCNRCGIKLRDSAKFCPHCGTAVAASETTASETTAPVDGADVALPSHAAANPEKSGKSKTVFLLAAGIAVLLLLAVLALFFLGGNPLVGTWVSETEIMGVTSGTAYTFHKNDTGTLTVYTSSAFTTNPILLETEFTYKTSGKKLLLHMNGEEIEMDFRIKGDSLWFFDSANGGEIEFRKGTLPSSAGGTEAAKETAENLPLVPPVDSFQGSAAEGTVSPAPMTESPKPVVPETSAPATAQAPMSSAPAVTQAPQPTAPPVTQAPAPSTPPASSNPYESLIAEYCAENDCTPSELQMVSLYLNDDDIPELWFSNGIFASGGILCTYNGVETDSVYTSADGFDYVERGNRFKSSNGNMGLYFDTIYAIENGKFVTVGYGEQVIKEEYYYTDPWTDDKFDYTWNGQTVSAEEYQALSNIH